MTKNQTRAVRIAGWFFLVAICLYLFFFRREFVRGQLQNAVSRSMLLGYGAYLFLGCLRGFTLIPSTNLILLGIPFFPPMPLFVLSLIGIMISSATVYYFSEALHLDEIFEKSHKAHLEKLKAILQRNQLPIIVGWSFFPLAPTDLICYVCGTLRLNFPKFVLGVLLGEGIICALYIFLGDTILQFFRLR